MQMRMDADGRLHRAQDFWSLAIGIEVRWTSAVPTCRTKSARMVSRLCLSVCVGGLPWFIHGNRNQGSQLLYSLHTKPSHTWCQCRVSTRVPQGFHHHALPPGNGPASQLQKFAPDENCLNDHRSQIKSLEVPIKPPLAFFRLRELPTLYSRLLAGRSGPIGRLKSWKYKVKQYLYIYILTYVFSMFWNLKKMFPHFRRISLNSRNFDFFHNYWNSMFFFPKNNRGKIKTH